MHSGFLIICKEIYCNQTSSLPFSDQSIILRAGTISCFPLYTKTINAENMEDSSHQTAVFGGIAKLWLWALCLSHQYPADCTTVSWGDIPFPKAYICAIKFLLFLGWDSLPHLFNFILFMHPLSVCVCIYILHLESTSWDLEVILKLIFRDLALRQAEPVTLRIG